MEYKILEELSKYGLLKDFLKSKILENKILMEGPASGPSKIQLEV